MKFCASKEPLADHFLAFDKLIRDLKMTGAKMEETDIVCHLLITMPSEYDNIVTVIETLNVEKKNDKRADCRVKGTKSKTGASANLTSDGTVENHDSENAYCSTAGTIHVDDNGHDGSNFYLDSGATEHLIRKDVVLTNVRKLSYPIKIKVAKKGTMLMADRMGGADSD